MQNVEFKCELRDADLAVDICRRLGAVHIATLTQTDTYFRVPDGRLKRRESSDEPVEWICYSRDDGPRAKVSTFTIYSDDEARARYGEAPLPVWVVVRKRRDLWIKDAVRIHLDDVDGLGAFIEFEAMVSRRQDVAKCRQAIDRLRLAFAPTLGESISCGYSDLVAAEAT